jgi:hypothetical protein
MGKNAHTRSNTQDVDSFLDRQDIIIDKGPTETMRQNFVDTEISVDVMKNQMKHIPNLFRNRIGI